MIEGHINEHGLPMISMHLGGQDWRACIDTGFNGDLELPTALQSKLMCRPLGRSLSILAGGQSLVEDAFLVELEFDGRVRTAEVTFAPGNEILIGTLFLSEYCLTIDFPKKLVQLVRLA